MMSDKTKSPTHLDNPTTKQHFNNFLYNWKKASMMHTNTSAKKILYSNNLYNTYQKCSSITKTLSYTSSHQLTCGKFLSDPFSRENALSQKSRISLFSELLVRSVPVRLSADLSQRFLEKQNITTCIPISSSNAQLNFKIVTNNNNNALAPK